MFPSTSPFAKLACPLGRECEWREGSCPYSHHPSASPRHLEVPSVAFYHSKGDKKRSISTAEPAVGAANGAPNSKARTNKREAPQIPLQANCKFPWKTRQAALEKLYEALGGQDCDEDGSASKEAIDVEGGIYAKASSTQVYRSLFASQVQRLRQSNAKGPSRDITEQQASHPPASLGPESPGDQATPVAILRDLAHSVDVLRANGYTTREGTLAPPPRTDQHSSSPGDEGVRCVRCQSSFDPPTYYEASKGTTLDSPKPCTFHYGRKVVLSKAIKERCYSCCQRPLHEDGCTTAPLHVFSQRIDPATFREIAPCTANPAPPGMKGDDWPCLPFVALDAEMLYTVAGTEIARLSIVNWSERTVLDVFVRPQAHIVDYNTRFSGITEEMLAESVPIDTSLLLPLASGQGGKRSALLGDLCKGPKRIVSFEDLTRYILPLIIGPDTIISGHSLENDLNVLKVPTGLPRLCIIPANTSASCPPP